MNTELVIMDVFVGNAYKKQPRTLFVFKTGIACMKAPLTTELALWLLIRLLTLLAIIIVETFAARCTLGANFMTRLFLLYCWLTA